MSNLSRVEIAVEGMEDGTMKEVPFGDGKVLISKVEGKFYATSHKCSHYGAPLIKGVISATGSISCPWHGAKFSCKGGEIEDGPGLGGLQSFKVDLEGTSVFVTAPTDEKALHAHQPPPSVSLNASATAKAKKVLIIGGGAGSAHAIEGLREAGFEGSIRVISKENHLPIDRTKLSKALISDPSKVMLRDAAFYASLEAEFLLDQEATKIDFKANSVTLSNGSSESYDYLIVATGSNPNRLPVDGGKLGNIFVMRNTTDTGLIDAALGEGAEKQVVVVGSSFIGMESALACSKRAKQVSVIGMEAVPFEAILGKEIGLGIQKFHEAQSTKFYLSASLSHFVPAESNSGNVGAVILKDGTSIPADVVILGVGVRPATQLLKDSGLELERDGGIIVDSDLKIVSVPQGNVFAVGDIAKFPDGITGALTRIEHWNVASNHGRNVAQHIAGKGKPFNKVPVFWSAQGQQLRYAGSAGAKDWQDVIIQGEPNDLKFVAYYTKGDEVVAVASMQKDPIVAHCSELFALGKMISASAIKGGQDPLTVRLA